MRFTFIGHACLYVETDLGSLIVDPWGVITAVKGEGPGIVVGDVDPARIAEVRAQLPALAHRVM